MKKINTFTNIALLIGTIGPLLLTLAVLLVYITEEQAILVSAVTGSLAIIFSIVGRHRILRDQSGSLISAWVAFTIGLANFTPLFLLTFGFVLLPLGILLIVSFGISSFMLKKHNHA